MPKITYYNGDFKPLAQKLRLPDAERRDPGIARDGADHVRPPGNRLTMARHKVPRYVAFVDSFPMNAAGKILKYKMREDAVEKLGLQKAASVVTA